MKFKFVSDPAEFDVVADSQLNSQYAMAVIDAILLEPRCQVFRKGMRVAAHQLDKDLGIDSLGRAVFVAHGETGYMSPNQYWTPGMLSNMPMMGKYFVYYGSEFVEPYTLGRKNVERMTYELFNENSGICRFHRKWAEYITDEILVAHYDLKVNYKNHQFELAREIYQREMLKAVPWECGRLIDLVLGFLELWEKEGLQDPKLAEWLARFRQDKQQAALDFWNEIQRGVADAFAAGPDQIPEQLTPWQSGKLKPQNS